MSAAIALPQNVQEMSATDAKVALVRTRRNAASMKRLAAQDAADVFGGVVGIAAGVMLKGIGIPLPGGRKLSINTAAGIIGLVMLFRDNPISRTYGRAFTQSVLMGMGSVDAVAYASEKIGSLGSLAGLFGK